MGKSVYFKGWYFKHAMPGTVLSLIPGVSHSKGGTESAFIQVIAPGFSQFLKYPRDTFRINEKENRIRIGNNFFSPEGISLCLSGKNLKIEGEIRYSCLTPIRRSLFSPTLMGPFSYLGFMECCHDILSLSHLLSGSLRINGKTICWNGGTGYLEKDSGRSFPDSWVWYQSNLFERPSDCVMLAAAKIPAAGFAFTGLLCECRAGGEEYRLATYCGGRLTRLEQTENEAFLEARQRDLCLQIHINTGNTQPLAAPFMGGMERIILEQPCCSSRVLLTREDKILFQDTGACAGFERVGNPFETRSLKKGPLARVKSRVKL